MFQGVGLVEKYNNEATADANLMLKWNFNRHRKYYQWLIYRELLYINHHTNDQNDNTTN